MKTKTLQQRSPDGRISGFTLVEMLVSVALVLIMMVIFAQVFELAIGAVTTMKGAAENDQRMRMLDTIVRDDLQNRTFKKVLPWVVADEANGYPDASIRRGYFYISENDPLIGTDDVLQLSIEMDENSALYGRALLVGDVTNLGQPEADDAVLTWQSPNWRINVNKTGASRWGEVCYYIRNGTLRRRVMLLRQPYVQGGATPAGLTGDYAGTSPSFWQDFDYSAYYGTSGLTFLQYGDREPGVGVATCLASPFCRFGFDRESGNPREFADDTLAATFFGRFLTEETAHAQFLYPGKIPDLDGDASADDPPLNRSTRLGYFGGYVSYRAGTDGTWNTSDDVNFANFERRGDDILLSNVHEFDIKVWDPTYDEDTNNDGNLDGTDENGNGIVDSNGAFVDIGNAFSLGSYSQGNNLHVNPVPNTEPQITYGPTATTASNRVFDTWYSPYDHDNSDGDNNPATDPDPPPFTTQLQAIQITVRFFDVSSQQMRQMTIVESLLP